MRGGAARPQSGRALQDKCLDIARLFRAKTGDQGQFLRKHDMLAMNPVSRALCVTPGVIRICQFMYWDGTASPGDSRTSSDNGVLYVIRNFFTVY